MTDVPRRTSVGQAFAGSSRICCRTKQGTAAKRASAPRSRAWLASAACLLLAACAATPGFSAATSGPQAAQAGFGVVKIGVELPMSGGEAPNGVPTLNAVRLAIADINAAGGIDGYKFGVNAQDDAVNGSNNPQQGARNITTLVGDPSVIGVVGPYNSSVAKAEIPISNAAGLLQCSPSNTAPGLTKVWGGVDPKTYRPTHPDRIAYVRVAPTDDLQGLAGAAIAYQDLGLRRAYIVDDSTTYGEGLADVFDQQFRAMGGTVVKHDGASAAVTDYTGLVAAAEALNPDVVYYGGVTTSGGWLLRRQMVAAGMAKIPFIGGDGISDGSAATANSFLNLAGTQGDTDTYSTVAAAHTIPNEASFAARWNAAYGAGTRGAYSASAYACTQIILDAFRHAGKPDRAAVRQYITGGAAFTTALGTIQFDANGDTNQKIISEYTFDPTLNGGDWAFVKQVDFGESSGPSPALAGG
jgi:branched-chain amino acid transport system substrate-binding protein